MPRVIVSDGAEINYYLDDFVEPWIEEKDTIFMNHGCAETSKMFIPMVPLLARRYRVVRIDERGMGESPLPPGGYKASSERFVEDVLNVIDQLGIEKIHFVGGSSGGMIGMYFALSHPSRLKSLILLQTPYRVAPFPGEKGDVRQRYRLGEKDIGTAILKYGLAEWQRRVPGYQCLDLSKVDSKVQEWYYNDRTRNPKEASAGRYNWAYDVDLSDRLAEIKVPTLIITSVGGSYQTPLEMSRFMEQQIPNAKLALIDGGFSQAVNLVVPDRCAEAVLEFLKTID